MTADAKLGPALLGLRRRNNWTLRDVSERTGLSIATLSKAERNKVSLTYDKLRLLSEGLGVDIATFFDGDAADSAAGATGSRLNVHRRSEGRDVVTPNYRHVYLNAGLLNKKFIPIVAEVKARSIEEFGPLVRHTGEEFAYVLQGKITVHTEHYAPTLLSEGDAVYFDSQMGHAYIAAEAGPCRILSINTAPEATLLGAFKAKRSNAKPVSPAAARKRKAR